MMTKMKKAAEPDNTERKLFLKYIEYTKERLVSALIEAESELDYIRGLYAARPDNLNNEIEELKARNRSMMQQLTRKQ